MHKLVTTIDISAKPQKVWQILTSLDEYNEWNPFIVRSEGKVEVGEKLVNRMQPPGGKAMTFKPTVTEVRENQTFEWLGRLGFPGIFDGRHRFELEATEAGTRLTHSETFTGILVRPLKKSLDTQTLKGFEMMNEALKKQAEKS